MDKFNNKYRIPSARLQSWDYGSNGAYFITICTHNRKHFFGKTIDNGIMQLNELGQIAEKYWMEIPTQYPYIELGNFVIMPNHMHGILIINKSDAILSPSAGNFESRPILPSANLSPSAGEFDAGPILPFANLQFVQTRFIASQLAPIAPLVLMAPFKQTRLIASLATAQSIPSTTAQSIPSTTAPSTPPTNKPIGGITGDKNPMLHDNISRIIRWYKGRCSFEINKIHANFGWQSRFHDHIIRDAQSFENIQNYIANNPVTWHKDVFNK